MGPEAPSVWDRPLTASPVALWVLVLVVLIGGLVGAVRTVTADAADGLAAARSCPTSDATGC